MKKRCSSCRKQKEFSEFSNSKTGKYGKHHHCRKCKAAFQKQRYHKAKEEVFNHYCNGDVKCQCPKCDVVDARFLTVDHIKNDGAKHRRKIGEGPWVLYWWLKKNGFPEGYRIYCYNCNCGRQRNNGICPHEDIR
jgi:hypothetical protein